MSQTPSDDANLSGQNASGEIPQADQAVPDQGPTEPQGWTAPEAPEAPAPQIDTPEPQAAPDPTMPYPGQAHPAQPYPAQPYPEQPYPDQPYAEQPYAEQPYPQQPYPGQPTTAQPYPSDPYAAQPYPGAAYGAYGQPGEVAYAGFHTEITPNDRNWASAAHWGALVAAWFAMGFLAPLLVMLTAGNQSPFVRRHAVESLNFQISLLIYSAVAVLVSILTLGIGLLVVIPVVLVALVWALVVIIQASMRASQGRDYSYPLTLRLVH